MQEISKYGAEHLMKQLSPHLSKLPRRIRTQTQGAHECASSFVSNHSNQAQVTHPPKINSRSDAALSQPCEAGYHKNHGGSVYLEPPFATATDPRFLRSAEHYSEVTAGW
jgi:hypothetical protein